jgi:hypothetical protein
MNSNMDILKTMLLTWSDDEVSKAWTLVAEEGNLRKAHRTKNMKSALTSGDKVSFNGRTGLISGTIVRIKTKKAIVEVAGQNWDVPLSMLKKE